jgi:hypothetical protein
LPRIECETHGGPEQPANAAGERECTAAGDTHRGHGGETRRFERSQIRWDERGAEAGHAGKRFDADRAREGDRHAHDAQNGPGFQAHQQVRRSSREGEDEQPQRILAGDGEELSLDVGNEAADPRHRRGTS